MDQSSGREYFYHRANGVSQWERPMAPASDPQHSAVGALEALAFSNGVNLQQLPHLHRQ